MSEAEDGMLAITYQSEASFPFAEEDLAMLLLNSRATNARSGLTGLLVHRDGVFTQYLEGPSDVVRARFAIIAADPRHRAVVILSEERIAARRHPAWSMGYRTTLDPSSDPLPGFRAIPGSGAVVVSEGALPAH